MLNEYGHTNNKKIVFRHDGKSAAYDSTTGLTLFRIIQYQLKNAHNCGAKKISIQIKTNKTIRLEFIDDGKNTDAFKAERRMILRHIQTRIGIVKGKVAMNLDKLGNNLLEIEIPLAVS